MAGKERRRMQVSSAALGLGIQNVVSIAASKAVNMHDIRGSISIEPENADANSVGLWGLIMMERTAVANPFLTVGALNPEAENPLFIAWGTYAASNQTPFNHEFHVKTSRNVPEGGRVTLIVH